MVKPSAPPSADCGFSLLEMLVALGLTLLVTSAAFALVNPAQATSLAQPEAMDMQQRARASADAVVRDLAMAGAGVYAGPNDVALVNALAPVIPRKMGLQNPDSPRQVRSDAITITYVPATYSQTTTSTVVPQAAGLTVTTQSNCPIGQALCGFQAGSTALVFDASGYFDVFTITQIQGASGQLQSHGQGSGFLHAAGANVVEAETHTYYLDAAASQLRHYDGYQTDVPVADNVVGLTFDYFGDPAPPRQPKPPAGSENCLYDLAGAPKLTTTLAVNGGTLAPLPLSILGDGPWCGGGGTEFDADLLRVRVVRVTLRVQASQAAFRSGGPSFVKPGTSQNSNRYLPDLVTTFSVTPRNLGLSR